MKTKRWFGWAALACAICCSIPLLLLGAGGLAAVSLDQWICGGILLLVAAGWFWMRQRRSASGCAIPGADSCSVACGCKSR